MISNDHLAGALWKIHCDVEKEGYVQVSAESHTPNWHAQLRKDLSLGIFRSDYMLHEETAKDSESAGLCIKQVEFNTFSVAGGAHSNKVSRMHQ